MTKQETNKQNILQYRMYSILGSDIIIAISSIGCIIGGAIGIAKISFILAIAMLIIEHKFIETWWVKSRDDEKKKGICNKLFTFTKYCTLIFFIMGLLYFK